MSGPLINPGKFPAPLLQQQRIEVRSERDMVVLQIGNGMVKMPYQTALQLAQWLRLHGKRAKANAGDVSRHWSCAGILDGLTDKQMADQKL